jgi:hypothetical protein
VKQGLKCTLLTKRTDHSFSAAATVSSVKDVDALQVVVQAALDRSSQGSLAMVCVVEKDPPSMTGSN